MKTDVALKWAEALESDRFKQGRGALNRDGKVCCLGVLCELAIQDGVEVSTRVSSYDGSTQYGNQTLVPPDSVRVWAGLPLYALAKEEDKGCLLLQTPEGKEEAFNLNDLYEWSFGQIASAVRETFGLPPAPRNCPIHPGEIEPCYKCNVAN